MDVAASAPAARPGLAAVELQTSETEYPSTPLGKSSGLEKAGSSSTATPPVGSSGKDISDVEFMSCDDDDSDFRWRSDSGTDGVPERESSASHILVGSLSQAEFFTPPHDPVRQLNAHDGSRSEPAIKFKYK